MEKTECQHEPICVITRQHGSTLQFAAVQKDSLFVPMAQAPPKAGARESSYNSLNLTHEFRPLFSPKVIFTGLLRKAFPQKHAFVDMSVFLWLRKQRSRFAQGQPKGYFQMKELDRTLNFGSSPECRIHVSYSLHFDTWKLGCKVDHTKSLG